MAEVVEPPRWLERWSARRIGVVAGIGLVGSLVGIAAAPPVGDALLIALAIGIAGGAGWTLRQRKALEALPLVLGDTAVRQVVDGVPTLRFRSWLGHGRAMRAVAARAVLHLPHGRDLTVPIDVPADHVCGPVTLTATLPPLATGELEVWVEARSGGKTWSTQRSYSLSSAPLGPLEPPVKLRSGRLEWVRASWDR